MGVTPYTTVLSIAKNHKHMMYRNGTEDFQTYIYKKEASFIANTTETPLTFEIDIFRRHEHKNYPAVIHFLYKKDEQLEIFRSYKISYEKVGELLSRNNLENVQKFLEEKIAEETISLQQTKNKM